MNDQVTVTLSTKERDKLIHLFENNLFPTDCMSAVVRKAITVSLRNAQPVQPSPLQRLEEWAAQSELVRTWGIEKQVSGHITARVHEAGKPMYSRTRDTLEAAINAALDAVEKGE